METFVSLALPAGLYANGTLYQSKGRWARGNLIRWLPDGSQYPPILPIGGWALTYDSTGTEIDAAGFPRGAASWRGNDGSAWLGLGTTGTTKAYAYSPSTLTDITPGGLVAGAADGSTITGSGAYGAGPYGVGLYGTGSTAAVFVDADTWSLDNFGEKLLGCLTSDGKIWIWDKNIANDFTQLTNAPTGCRAVVVTGERFIMALGASSNPRQVAWASQETETTWTPAVTNSAGDFVLQTNGRLIAGKRTPRETLLWTDADVWGAVYIGGPFIYRFDQRGDSCGLIGPNAAAIAEGAAYWMSDGQFFRYDGAVRQLPCEVSDYVFGDFQKTQKAKITAFANAAFGEVWWFYPSATQSGTENDRYVALNYRQGFWMTGSLPRAAGVGAGVFAQPMLWDSSGKLYAHEVGQDRGGENAYIESGPLELGNGDRTLSFQKLLPDDLPIGQVEATFFASFQPHDPEQSYGPYALTGSTDIRGSGRQVRVRFEQIGDLDVFADGSFLADGSLLAGPSGTVDFRLGTMRLGVIPMGFR